MHAVLLGILCRITISLSNVQTEHRHRACGCASPGTGRRPAISVPLVPYVGRKPVELAG